MTADEAPNVTDPQWRPVARLGPQTNTPTNTRPLLPAAVKGTNVNSEMSDYHAEFEWRTVAVTPMPPGWVNAFIDTGTRAYFSRPVPALITQESDTIVESWTETGEDGTPLPWPDGCREKRSRVDLTRRDIFGAVNERGEIIPPDDFDDFFQPMSQVEFDEHLAGRVAGSDNLPVKDSTDE